MTGKIDIFVSYKREEQALARACVRALTEAGYTTVTDENIALASDWNESIKGMIEEAELVVVLWTHASIKSDWVRKEAMMAEARTNSEGNCKYFPIRVEPVETGKLPGTTELIQWLDVTDLDRPQAIAAIVDGVKTSLTKTQDSAEVAETKSADLRGDLEFFQVIDKVGRIDGYIKYLETYPQGLYTEQARARIHDLTTPLWRRLLPTGGALMVIAAFLTLYFEYVQQPVDASEFEALQKKVVTLTTERDRAREEAQAATDAVGDLQSQVATLEGARAGDARAVDAARKAEAEWKARAEQAAADLATANSEIDRLKAKRDPAEGSSGKELEAYRLAESLIRDAKAGRWKFLNLSSLTYAHEYSGEIRAGGSRLKNLTRIPPEIADLTALQRLDLDGTQVRNLEPLKGMTELQWLDLSGTQVQNLDPLSGMTALQRLDLGGTQVRNLEPLRGMTALQGLFLRGTQVQNLEPLRGMTDLYLLCPPKGYCVTGTDKVQALIGSWKP